MSNTEKWNKWLKDYGLAHKAEQIAAYTRSSIRMVAKQNADEEIPIGHSKIGGCRMFPQILCGHIRTIRDRCISFANYM